MEQRAAAQLSPASITLNTGIIKTLFAVFLAGAAIGAYCMRETIKSEPGPVVGGAPVVPTPATQPINIYVNLPQSSQTDGLGSAKITVTRPGDKTLASKDRDVSATASINVNLKCSEQGSRAPNEIMIEVYRNCLIANR